MKLFKLTLLLITTLQLHAQLAITMPGDFEKQNGLLLAWSDNMDVNLVTTLIISEVQQTTDSIWLLYQSNSPTMDSLSISAFITSHGATLDNIYYVPSNYETNQIRNFLPGIGYATFDAGLQRFMYNSEYSQGGTPAEDSIAAQLATLFNFPLAEIPIVTNGSDLLHDGMKNGFSTRNMLYNNPTYTENQVKLILEDAFNLNNWIFLEPLLNSGGGADFSIDNFMQIIDFETVIFSSYPDSLPDYPILEQNVTEVEGLLNAFGQPYTIYRIPAAPLDDGQYPSQPEDEIRTYTNALIVNELVFIPSYGLQPYDSVAKAIYRSAMPGYEVIPVVANLLTQQFGSLKSLAMPIPQANYLRIEHKKLTGIQTFQPEIQITCISKAGDLVEEMWLYYKINQDTNYTKTPVYLVCPEHFGKIEGISITDTVSYYIEAISTRTTTTYPLAAPEGNFTFWFDPILEMQESGSHETVLYPNPGNGSFRLKLGNKMAEAEVRIFDMDGRILFHDKVTGYEQVILNKSIATGLYLVQVITHDNNEIIRLIVE